MSDIQGGDEAEDLAATEAMLALIDAMPDLLPVAVKLRNTSPSEAAHMRVCHEEHPCLRCGKSATEAFILKQSADGRLRWLDLCGNCAWLVNRVAEDQRH